MPMRWLRECGNSCRVRRSGRRWPLRRAHSMRRTREPRRGCGRGSNRSSLERRPSAAKIAVDPLHVRLGQRPDSLLQLELADQEVVVRLHEVESRLEYLLLLIEDVQI